VANSVGYASSSDSRVHFGLGDERAVNIEIHWPSGMVQEIKNVTSDQLLLVQEASAPQKP
jgi:hypothetical protein